MCDFDYDSDDFDINIDDPGEASSRNADAMESMNIPLDGWSRSCTQKEKVRSRQN